MPRRFGPVETSQSMENTGSFHLEAHVKRVPPRLNLASLPTPVEPLAVPGGRDVWIKRDDRSSDRYGGGKVRKLEFILAQAEVSEARRIRSIGAFGSHHLLALAIHGEVIGLGVDAIVAPQVVTKAAVRNLAALTSLGARFIPVMDRLCVPWGMWKGHRDGGAVFLGPGGSNAAGCLGWVEAGLELCRQVASGELATPSQIYITAGTAGTSAGLLVGLTLGGMRTHLRLVSAVEPLYFNRFIFRQKVALAWRAVNDLGLRTRSGRGDVRWSIDHSQVGGGYAVPSPGGRAAVQWAGNRGVSLETTYTGKCAAALMGDLRAGRVEGCTLLWNTHASTDVSRYISEGWRETLPASMRRWIGAVSSR